MPPISPPNLKIGVDSILKNLIFPLAVQLSAIGITGLFLSNQLQEVKKELKKDNRDLRQDTANLTRRVDDLTRRVDEVYSILFAARFKSRCNSEEVT
ncbi:hypothetical protein MMC07_001105 [Pseudocyphellaria aurata]|nr:hypothetical protein [Pseudocyphellaria aurata]